MLCVVLDELIIAPPSNSAGRGHRKVPSRGALLDPGALFRVSYFIFVRVKGVFPGDRTLSPPPGDSASIRRVSGGALTYIDPGRRVKGPDV